MAGKPRLSPEERAARRKACIQRCLDRRGRREAAELALARATVAAHRMLGEAIEAAKAAGIDDPHTLVAEYVADIGKIRAAEVAREAKNEGV